MDADTFWNVIESAHQASSGDMDKQVEFLLEALTNLPEQDIIEFDRLLWEMVAQAYRANLWEACDVIHCGCSDDGFMDFRGWLIAQGKDVFEKALQDPESLADIVDTEHRDGLVMDGRLLSVPLDAYERRTGREIPLSEGISGGSRMHLVGETGPEKDRPAKFPRIMAKLGDCDDWFEEWLNKTYPKSQ